MKYTQTLIFTVLCSLLLMLAVGARAQSTRPGAVTVVRISGEAKYSLGDGVWHPLVDGEVLAAGSVIQTGHDATVDIVLGKKVSMPESEVPNRISAAPDSPVRGLVAYKPEAEQNSIRMASDTILAIDKLTVSDTGVDSVSDTELDLRQGGIYNSVKKLSGASQYLIKIPNGIAGIRGTLFYIDVTGKCSVVPRTDESTPPSSVVLSLIGASGKPMTVVVGQGQQFDPQSGKTSPLTPDIITEVEDIFAALCTTYMGEVNFTYDQTQCHVSPTRGHHRP
jgi:hypothetical protein